MNVYDVRGFWSVFKMPEKSLKIMHARIVLPHSNRMKGLKKIGIFVD